MTFRVSKRGSLGGRSGPCRRCRRRDGRPRRGRVVEALQGDRKAAGLEPFERRPAIDAVAPRRHAQDRGLVARARLTHEERSATRCARGRRCASTAASAHVNTRPAATRTRRRGSSRELSAQYRAGGARARSGLQRAQARRASGAEDGWTIFVACSWRTRAFPDDPRRSRPRSSRPSNRARAEQGLPALVETPSCRPWRAATARTLLRPQLRGPRQPGRRRRSRARHAGRGPLRQGRRERAHEPGREGPRGLRRGAVDGERRTSSRPSSTCPTATPARAWRSARTCSLYFTQLFLDPLGSMKGATPRSPSGSCTRQRFDRPSWPGFPRASRGCRVRRAHGRSGPAIARGGSRAGASSTTRVARSRLGRGPDPGGRTSTSRKQRQQGSKTPTADTDLLEALDAGKRRSLIPAF